jgi:TatD DNase family protein
LLIDTHAHINFDSYAEDREEMFSRALDAGVDTIVCVGMLPAGGEEALALARQYPGRVLASVGCHPYDAALLDEATLAAMDALLAEPEMVLVGEMGIDTVKADVPIDVQQAAFARQLELAVSHDLPVCIHSREAFSLCAEVIRSVCPDGWKGFAHCFSDGVEEALGWRDLGFVISFAGQITFKNKSCEPIRDAARELSPEDVVVETDCPFLAPTPHRGRRNEPAYVLETARKLAELWDLPEEDVFRRTSATARRVLGLPDPG